MLFVVIVVHCIISVYILKKNQIWPVSKFEIQKGLLTINKNSEHFIRHLLNMLYKIQESWANSTTHFSNIIMIVGYFNSMFKQYWLYTI